MPGTITISSSYGAGGAVVGPAVAEQLGLNFFDRAVPVEVARKLDVGTEEALAKDWQAPGRLERWLYALAAVATPMSMAELPADLVVNPNRFKNATEEVIRRIADTEGGVLLGRASMVTLAGRPDVLCVRLDGRAEDRIAQVVAQSGVDEATVRAEQKHTDAAREAYGQAFYGVGQSDPFLYHLWLDSTALSTEACTSIIVAAARDRLHLA